MDKTYDEKRRMQIQGRYNLEMGIHLAAEDFFNECERRANDESIPDMPPEKVKELFAAVHAEARRARARMRRKKLLNQLVTIVKYAAPAVVAVLIATVLILAKKLQQYKTA